MKIGDRVGSYLVTRRLGEGGMGEVFEAVHEVIGKLAAIKILKAEWAQSAEIGNRFLNEARAVNLIKHPGIVSIYEFGRTDDGAAYMVMEFLEGKTLSARMSQQQGSQPAPIPDVVRTAKQLAAALAAAHQYGVIHRDLKPDNIFIVPDSEVTGGERAKILDFGLAKLAVAAGQGPARVRTRSDVGMGTPDYMAPEQCFSANQVDGRADVYSLGCVVFELLTGRLPFLGEAQAVMRQRIVKDAPSLAELVPEASPELSTIVQRMLGRERETRPTMAEVLKAFEELAARAPGPPIPRPKPAPAKRRWQVFAVVGAAVVLAGVGAIKQMTRAQPLNIVERDRTWSPARGAAVWQLPASQPQTGAAPVAAKSVPEGAPLTPPASPLPAPSAASKSSSQPAGGLPEKDAGTSRRLNARHKIVSVPTVASRKQPSAVVTPAPAKENPAPAPEPTVSSQPTHGLRNDRIPSLLDKMANPGS